MATRRVTEKSEPESITAAAGLVPGVPVGAVVGQVVEALQAEGADLGKGVTLTVDTYKVQAVGTK